MRSRIFGRLGLNASLTVFNPHWLKALERDKLQRSGSAGHNPLSSTVYIMIKRNETYCVERLSQHPTSRQLIKTQRLIVRVAIEERRKSVGVENGCIEFNLSRKYRWTQA